MQMSQSGQRSALNEFFQWESQAWVEAVADLSTDEKVYFMPLEKVKSYFTANDNCALSKILVELFKTDFPPIDPELLLRDHTAIFCILLRIGKGEFIEDFAQYEELSDRRLPFDPKRPPEEFTNITDDEAFLERFCEKQRMYCVPVFDGHMLHKNFGRQRLLPIISAEAHEKDGLVRKYVIEVYGPHNRLHASKGKKDTAKTNTFVLKRYPKMAEIDYKQEVNGFRSVKQSESIIKFYGSFIQGDDYNILLEFADRGSLEQYFEKESPPSRGADIIKFWEALFQLIKGLKAIHSVRPAHLNVNPESISVLSGGEVSSSDWQFKFSNFGLINGDSEFVQRDSHTYKAPEHDGSSSSTWAADIWSLGCIYSEAAMWIADGYKGIEEYRRQRMAESETASFRGMDGFHDGSNVLQTVLDAHRDIEDRLRRSDYITKDVLDSMVEEMLWEEDRPNAKALARKADTILARARQKVSSISGDDSSRPPSSQSRPLPPPRLRPPTQPLPPIPRVLSPGLSSIAEQQQPPNVDKWRAQIQELQVPRSLFNNGPSSGSSSPTVPHQQLSSAESVSDFDRDLTGSVASWNFGDTNSTTSPSTPFSSPHVSAYYDYQGHNPNEGRPRAMPPQVSQEYRIPLPPRSTSRGHSYQIRQHSNSVDSAQAPSAPPSEIHPALRMPDLLPSSAIDTLPGQNQTLQSSDPPHSRRKEQHSIDDSRTIGRAGSRASSRHSSNFSISRSSHSDEKAPVQTNPQKRIGGFSLFPVRTQRETAKSPDIQSPERSFFSRKDSVASHPSSRSTDRNSYVPDAAPNSEYLSVNTCLQWKIANKKVKKSSKVPPLPGVQMLGGLNDRDHVFIIDDSASMQPVWSDVKRVFEALSYVVKGMSPDGTELFFTIAYDTWRRKDTSDLCTYLDKKTIEGETNISYRLNLQLQSYRARLYNARGQKGSKGVVRPMSFYVLTNGDWGPGPDPKIAINAMTKYLLAEKMTDGQVTIEFISFAQSAAAVQKIHDLAKTDFGMDIVDCTPWTGNVLKMLRGPLDKEFFKEDDGRQSGVTSPTSPTINSNFAVLNELA